MGIVLLFIAPSGAGVDPFATPVNWRGALTHGHLAENDNHGGAPIGMPDPPRWGPGRSPIR